MCEAHAGLTEISRRRWLTRMLGGAIGMGLGVATIGKNSAWAQTVPLRFTPVIVNLRPGAGAVGMPMPPGSTDVRAYIASRGDDAYIIDTLTANNATAIGDGLKEIGLDWDNVRGIIVSHLHPDHQGSLTDVANFAPGVPIYAGAVDLPSIRSPRPILPLVEGDTVFGMRVYDTPGHTPGHIVLHEPASNTALISDAAMNRGGALSILASAAETDRTLASLARLGGLGATRALFGHGLEIERNASQSLAAWANEQRMNRFFARLSDAAARPAS